MTLKHFNKDFSAGLSVFLVTLPLCLGIALASGAPLFSGLLAGIVGGIVVTLFSGSEVSVSGPAAGLTIIVLDSIEVLGSFSHFLTAVVLAGAFQYVLGWLKAGRLSSGGALLRRGRVVQLQAVAGGHRVGVAGAAVRCRPAAGIHCRGTGHLLLIVLALTTFRQRAMPHGS